MNDLLTAALYPTYAGCSIALTVGYLRMRHRTLTKITAIEVEVTRFDVGPRDVILIRPRRKLSGAELAAVHGGIVSMFPANRIMLSQDFDLATIRREQT